MGYYLFHFLANVEHDCEATAEWFYEVLLTTVKSLVIMYCFIEFVLLINYFFSYV
jgi:hypothetical protein